MITFLLILIAVILIFLVAKQSEGVAIFLGFILLIAIIAWLLPEVLLGILAATLVGFSALMPILEILGAVLLFAGLALFIFLGAAFIYFDYFHKEKKDD